MPRTYTYQDVHDLANRPRSDAELAALEVALHLAGCELCERQHPSNTPYRWEVYIPGTQIGWCGDDREGARRFCIEEWWLQQEQP